MWTSFPENAVNWLKIKHMRVIIAGGREFTDYPALKEYCDVVLADIDVTHVVSGCARGADTLGEKWAAERGYKVERHPADWNTHGKAAGLIRNREMAENGDILIAFWDGESGGTGNMISIAKRLGLKVFIKRYDKE